MERNLENALKLLEAIIREKHKDIKQYREKEKLDPTTQDLLDFMNIEVGTIVEMKWMLESDKIFNEDVKRYLDHE